MVKLKNKYVIGTHVMFFEIEMYKDFIDGLVNLLETVENKENVTIDLCFNLSEQIEKIYNSDQWQKYIISIAIRSINSIPDAFKRNPDTFLSSLEKKPSKFCITILGTQ